MEFQPLDVERIRTQLSDATVGSDLRYYPRVGSTNEVAAQLESGTWHTGTVILTDYQESGRGRAGRTWLAPPGTSILLSTLFELASAAGTQPAKDLGRFCAELSMIASLAVGDAIERAAGLSTSLKWPNDVLVNDRKIAGILGETRQEREGGRAILGMGINANFLIEEEEGLAESATTLQSELGHSVDREDLVVGVCKALDMWYGCLSQAPDATFSAWVERLATIGNQVLVTDSSRTWMGQARGVQRDGALVVREPSGSSQIIYAADVSIRTLDKVPDA